MALILWCVEHCALCHPEGQSQFPEDWDTQQIQHYLLAVVLVGQTWWKPLWQQKNRPWRPLWLMNNILATLEIHRLLETEQWKPKSKEWNETLRRSVNRQTKIDWQER